MNEKYEAIFIIKEDCDEKKIMNEIDNVVTEEKGKIYRKENLGLRKLAYEVKGYRNGYYYLINYEMLGNNKNSISKIEKQINTIEEVIKYIIIRNDEY